MTDLVETWNRTLNLILHAMDATYFEELIRIHQDAISSFKKWVTVLVIAGTAILILASVVLFLDFVDTEQGNYDVIISADEGGENRVNVEASGKFTKTIGYTFFVL